MTNFDFKKENTYLEVGQEVQLCILNVLQILYYNLKKYEKNKQLKQ